MFKGLYTATSGMMASERKQQYLTNNLSNAETPGFKQDVAALRSFPEYLLKERNTNASQANSSVGTLQTGVYTQEGIPSFTSGALKETGNVTDMALVDEGLPVDEETGKKGLLLFGVQLDDNSIRYTRNGNFTVNEDGFLTTSEGYRVVNEQLQPIQLTSESFSMENGMIIEEDGNQQNLWIGYTGDPEQLTQEGNGVFAWSGEENTAPQNVETTNFNQFSVKQGFLEGSNVDMTTTMTDMLNTYRLYEANQRVLQTYDQSIDKAVNDIGRVY
ncbi:flagellar hook-basal body protein [Guptibacillus hwajinpoensis]|uniref:Flagellar basal-body rod protein FlgG n=1 Tax=Guptibacillus hwajinpoensis TaxID=208199 RepID=A0ABU0JYR5_9BACL|nr:flagellar hook-basal body protein [Alkalihalobacillus hemicentroti]MDQ0482235.1 flagellar basal-body rod protein FlgG [Alkalihalobacillus hemicentroti]